MSMEAGLHNKKKRKNSIILTVLVGIFFSAFFVFSQTKNIDNNVPFTSQAPLFEWDDPRQQDACEEASVLMSISWVYNIPEYSKEMWRDEIVDLADFQQEKYGEYRDTSLRDIITWMYEDYFEYKNAEIIRISSSFEMIEELEKGNVLIIQTNGKALNNPNFTGDGPERHMLLIKGYDYGNKEFIVNDPGTRNGQDYRYNEKLLYEAIRSYKTGFHIPFD
ncbi:MAG: C39 family peptidase [Patescibacteria group bacterium]|jgi:hypothetical protein|nr:C39 family peptidase [Patescibacteria group bacterium]